MANIVDTRLRNLLNGAGSEGDDVEDNEKEYKSLEKDAIESLGVKKIIQSSSQSTLITHDLTDLPMAQLGEG